MKAPNKVVKKGFEGIFKELKKRAVDFKCALKSFDCGSDSTHNYTVLFVARKKDNEK